MDDAESAVRLLRREAPRPAAVPTLRTWHSPRSRHQTRPPR